MEGQVTASSPRPRSPHFALLHFLGELILSTVPQKLADLSAQEFRIYTSNTSYATKFRFDDAAWDCKDVRPVLGTLLLLLRYVQLRSLI